jgi:hypothetical protein
MVLLNWYSYSLSVLFNWLGNVFEHSFHVLEHIAFVPNVLFIAIIGFLFLSWMYMLRQYDKQGKDKGLID